VASVEEIMDALGTQISTKLASVIPNLQAGGKLIHNPTPPSIDVFPGDPFIERFAMNNEWTFFFTIRPRVSLADHEGGQSLLLSMMDPREPTSITKAIESDKTLGGLVDDVAVVDGPTGYGTFPDPGSVDNQLLGAIWRVQVLP
jgi:hypothetical protein